MKRIYSFLFIVLFSFSLMISTLFAQEEQPNGWVWSVELYVGIEGNIPQPNNYTIQLNNVGTVWASENLNVDDYFINSNLSINNSNYPWPFINLPFFYWRGWDCVYSQNTNVPPVPAPVFGYGLYKISTNIENSAYFYIDYRDTRIPYSNYPHVGGDPIDFWLKYNYDSNTFSFSASPSGSTNNFVPISNGSYLKIWELKLQNPTPQVTLEFPEYWANCLAITNNGNNHPRLTWGPFPSSAITVNNYKIYRKYGSSPWEAFVTVSPATFEYVDNSVSLTPPGGSAGVNVQYKVIAIYNLNQITPATNIVTVNIIGQEIEKFNPQKNIINTRSSSLFQNYPNPFNPSTQIKFSINQGSFVTLKIYDILGREIMTLVNDNRQPGDYRLVLMVRDLRVEYIFIKFKLKILVKSKK